MDAIERVCGASFFGFQPFTLTTKTSTVIKSLLPSRYSLPLYHHISLCPQQGTNMAAKSKVFSTTELLEAILLQLPMKDVLLSQRVSKEWRDTIVGSTKLRELLFLFPIEEGAYEPSPGIA